MKIIRIEIPSGRQLEGMIDLLSDDFNFHYASIGNGLHGLQCEYFDEDEKHEQLMKLCKTITDATREIISLHGEQKVQASVATKLNR
jgi:hypothetical protein